MVIKSQSSVNTTLKACLVCGRHAKDQVCPFCGSLHQKCAAPKADTGQRLARTAIVAGSALALAACTPRYVPAYGAVPLDDSPRAKRASIGEIR